MSKLLLTYYGDDFTGSTDVMESLTLGGVPTVLFLETPTAEFIAERFPHVRAVGLAGVSRSMTPEAMEAELSPKFEVLKALDAPVVHYKVCSTFDSAPHIGSIGRATEVGWRIFEPRYVPLIVGSNKLKRYVAFGNLYATMDQVVSRGDEANGKPPVVREVTYRIDRHPVMSKHPITPMHEADLRLHLAQQTDFPIELVDMVTLDRGADAIDNRIAELLDEQTRIILFDTLHTGHLCAIGRVLWELGAERPAFVVGSSGVENALAEYWLAEGIVEQPEPITPPDPVDQLIVMVGSASPVTSEQMTWAFENGFTPIRLNTVELVNPDRQDIERERIVGEALTILGTGASVVMFTAFGNADPAIAETKAALERLGIDPNRVGSILGAQQGMIVRTLLERTGLRRACIAGGDTSGHAARQLGIYALDMRVPIAPGAPLCRAYSNNPQIDRIEISLKGGQNGKQDYFGAIRQGRALSS